MRECFDEGILQGYCDGELAPEVTERVGSHLAACATCRLALSEVESENLLLAQGLEPEFALSVPTERLRERVDAAIAGLPVANSTSTRANSRASSTPVRAWVQSVADFFTLSPQRLVGFAALAVVILFAAVFVSIRLRRHAANDSLAVVDNGKPSAPVMTPSPDSPAAGGASTPSPEKAPEKDLDIRVAKAPRRSTPRHSLASEESAHVKLLPGERSYLKTIAKLDNTLKAEGNKPMRPALQSEYERNLAMVDRAIAATRSAAKTHPNDPDAAEFMFAAYQTKVDFLNQVADSRLSNGRH